MSLSSSLEILIIIFLHLGSTISGDSAFPYYPIEDFAINCGSSGNSTAIDGREWIGDVGSKSNSSPQILGKSTTSIAVHQYLPADHLPYMTARISRSQFTYIFHVSPGQKFIRLHFYPSLYIGFQCCESFFSVKAGPYTLLSNFSACLAAQALGVIYFAKEFCVNVYDNQALSIVFSPSPSSSKDIYDFINGIEIVSMPTGLYYSRTDDLGVTVLGEKYPFYIDNRTALEMVHRLNIGGRSILSIEDFEMFRSWSEDKNYLLESDVVSVRTNVMSKYRNIPTYVAPLRVYQTAWSMGPKEQTLTWKLPVNLGFRYLVRLHFFELESGVTETGKMEFGILINNKITEVDVDVIKWNDGNGLPVYKDYVMTIRGDKTEGKCDIIIALHSKPKQKSGTAQDDALLNGLEIFKLSNPDNSLAEPNPVPMASWTSTLVRFFLTFGEVHDSTRAVLFLVGSACVLIILRLIEDGIFDSDKKVDFVQLVLQHGSNDHGIINSVINEKSLNNELYHRFSLEEINLATNNFDDAFVIGNGGFGKVYIGHMDDGVRTVAIKRLNLKSKQGAPEFWTEIEMLSTYRHAHLVSLIGYCDEGEEMLLVYEHMANGTLCDHLYKIRNKNGNGSGSGSSSLSWDQRLRICIGAARGLNYLHTGRGTQRGLIHRDVKSSNILLDINWVAKISDFGLSKSMDAWSMSRSHISTDIKGTFGYLDPEYFMTRRLTRKTDVFAFGVVLFEVLCGRPAVDISLEEEQHSLAQWAKHCIEEGTLHEIVDTSVREQISPQCLKAFADIANKCVLKLSSDRPTMAEVVKGLEFVVELQSYYFVNEEKYIGGGAGDTHKQKSADATEEERIIDPDEPLFSRIEEENGGVLYQWLFGQYMHKFN